MLKTCCGFAHFPVEKPPTYLFAPRENRHDLGPFSIEFPYVGVHLAFLGVITSFQYVTACLQHGIPK